MTYIAFTSMQWDIPRSEDLLIGLSPSANHTKLLYKQYEYLGYLKSVPGYASSIRCYAQKNAHAQIQQQDRTDRDGNKT